MNIFGKIRDFFVNLDNKVKSAGITAIGWGIATLVLFIFGFKAFSYIALGVFLTRNWDTIVRYVKGGNNNSGE